MKTELADALDVLDLTGGALTLGWSRRPACYACDEPTMFAGLNTAWDGEMDCRCTTCGPVMPLCPVCVGDRISDDVRARLLAADGRTT